MDYQEVWDAVMSIPADLTAQEKVMIAHVFCRGSAYYGLDILKQAIFRKLGCLPDSQQRIEMLGKMVRAMAESEEYLLPL